jgi:hypothetical protein
MRAWKLALPVVVVLAGLVACQPVKASSLEAGGSGCERSLGGDEGPARAVRGG